MKKFLIVALVLVILLAGLFFWKGGHHALVLGEILSEWADEDQGDFSLTVQANVPTFVANETVEPVVRMVSLSGDGFWTEHQDRDLYGFTTAGHSVYFIGRNIYMDTGAAYSLPDLKNVRASIREFATGLALYGRVTKTDRGYQVTMEREDTAFSANFVIDRRLQSATVTLNTKMDGQPVHLQVTMSPKESQPHPLPQTVLDAMVRAQMEPPMVITEPLEILLPALTKMIPMKGDLTLGVSCGILELSETVGLSVDQNGAVLNREGMTIEVSDDLLKIDPLSAAMAVLGNGTLTKNDDEAQFRMVLPADASEALAAKLVPQLQDLGIEFKESEAVLTIKDGTLANISMISEGEIPFLVTTIPLTFTAELNIP